MDAEDRFELLRRAARHEACGACGPGGRPPRGREAAGGVYVAIGAGGRPFPMLKTLQTTYCQRNCAYCEFRVGRDVPRASATPEEMVRRFEDLDAAGRVRGLFLSSGHWARGPGHAGRAAMDRIIATAELLRRRGYRGYVHLKVMPGADEAQIERAAAIANRLSVNLEAPTAERLERIAPRKSFRDELLAAADAVARVVATRAGRAVSWTTQFVVGAAGETDLELLGVADRLYRERSLRRAYYSGFEPVPGTPLENLPPAAPRRQIRLYQADWLLRFYGFSLRELPFDAFGALPETADPKTAWAALHPEAFPVEVNRADPASLLRVPGLGPASVRRIVAARAQGAIRTAEDLRAVGALRRRALAYLTLDGRVAPAHERRGPSAPPERTPPRWTA